MSATDCYLLHIDGERLPSSSGEAFESIDPTTNAAWTTVASSTREDVDRAVAAAKLAFEREAWRRIAPSKRGRLLMRLADEIAAHAPEIAALETRDNGKLLRDSLAQAEAVPDWLYYYGGLADKIEGLVLPVNPGRMLSYTLREPLGVVGVITPWNAPVILTLILAATALAAGNTIVVKPSEYSSPAPLEALALAERAGFPPGVVNVVTGGADVGEALVAHPGVAKIAFTGGSATGRRIAAVAGSRLAGCTLELGGKSPNIVFGDADLVAAEAGILTGIFAATGQMCMAGSRVFIQETIFERLVQQLVDRAQRIEIGDPMQERTQMGPVANRPQFQRVQTHVERARADGAEILTGGVPAVVPALPSGMFFTPTIVTGVANASAIAQEEIFGPVLTALPFSDEADVVREANATRYGLAAGVWTTNVGRAHRVAAELEAGTVWINTYRAASPAAPYGGFKDSGVGRSSGAESIDEYLQTKTVWCELDSVVRDPFLTKV